MKYGSAVILTLLFPVVAFGDVYIYPNKGQSQQQSQDRYECHTWAVQQTGFDPSRPPPAAAPAAPPSARRLTERRPSILWNAKTAGSFCTAVKKVEVGRP